MCEEESKICEINAPKGGKTNTHSIDERTSCFNNKDDQFDQKERRSEPCDVIKTNRYW